MACPLTVSKNGENNGLSVDSPPVATELLLFSPPRAVTNRDQGAGKLTTVLIAG